MNAYGEDDATDRVNRGEYVQINELLPDDAMSVVVRLKDGSLKEAYFENFGEDEWTFVCGEDRTDITHEVKEWRWLTDEELKTREPLTF